MKSLRLFVFLLLQFSLMTSFANNPGVSYQGRIFKPDGNPLEGSSVQFRLQVRSPGSENCLLYEEVQTLNMAGSSGVFALTLNDGTGTRLDTATYQVDRIFANRETMTLDTTRCATGTTYTPNSSDGRKLVVYFKDETMAAYEAMPLMNLNYVPQAMYALEAQKVDKFEVSHILRAVDGSGNPATAPALNPTQLTNLNSLLATPAANYVQTTSNGSVALPVVAGNPSSGLAAGQIWYDSGSNVMKYYDGAVKTFGTSGGGVTSVATGTGLTGGPITTTGTINVDVGVTTGKIIQVAASNKLPVIDGSNLTNINATDATKLPLAGGTMTGPLVNNSNSASTALAVTQAGAGYAASFMGGNVGIGTATPSSKLEVATSLTAASGTDYGVKILPTVNASGTAGYTGLLLNVAQTATGSGTKRLMDLQVGGFSLFSIGNTGTATMTSTSSAADFLVFNNHQGVSKAINFSGGQIPNAGSLLYYRTTSDPQSGIMGNLIDIQPIRFASSARTDTDTGNYLRIARANTVNNAVGSLTVTGDLASLSSNCTQTSGTCTDSSSILSLTQSYPNATGAVLTVTNSGTGSAATFMGGNVGIGTATPTTGLHVTTGFLSTGNTQLGTGAQRGGRLTVRGPNFGYPIQTNVIDNQSDVNFVALNETFSTFASSGLNIWQKDNGFGRLSISPTDPGGITINTSGKVGIGTTGPSTMLHVLGSSGTTIATFADGGATTCTVTPASTGFACSSDERLKKNIEAFSDAASLANILQLRTVTYDWRVVDNGRHTGYIAQELEKVAPEFVRTGEDGFKQVNYTGLVPWITGAIKAFYGEFRASDEIKSREIASVNSKADKLEAQNAAIKQENAELKARLDQQEKELAAIKNKLGL